MIRVNIRGIDGNAIEDAFLVDVGADRTVLSAHFFAELGLPGRAPDDGMMLEGISGKCTFVCVHTPLEFIRSDGDTIRVHGEYAALTDSSGADFSILGRDVLNNFDVIISRPRREVLLLADRHTYQVVEA